MFKAAIAAVAALGLAAGTASAQYPAVVPHHGHYHVVPTYSPPVYGGYGSPSYSPGGYYSPGAAYGGYSSPAPVIGGYYGTPSYGGFPSYGGGYGGYGGYAAPYQHHHHHHHHR